ncbi:PH domain-containing protein [Flaviaesturariibacter amylovorans]|uniref:Bacterial Pleckstrin homology domain-containing protein n=1 Tax=Flaviaesturariibacter amylovorans TaxID=1084520 RepID=A0ABP8GV80_9BACT
MNRDFPASMDRLCKSLTAVVTLLFLGVAAVQVSIWNEVPRLGPAIVIGFLAATWLLSFVLRPQGYRLTHTELIVCRTWSAVRIQRSDILRIEPVSKADLRGSIRLFGVGGLFGYYGRFANRALGSMTWYATHRNGGLLVRTSNGKKILITPDDPEALLQAWEGSDVRSVF